MKVLEKYFEARVKTGKWVFSGCCDATQIKIIKRVIKASKNQSTISAEAILKAYSKSKFDFRKAYNEALGSMEDILAATLLSVLEAAHHNEGVSYEEIQCTVQKKGYWTYLKDITKEILFEDYSGAASEIKGYAMYRKCHIDKWLEARALYELDLLT